MERKNLIYSTKELIQSEEYNFLRENEFLGEKIILLALGGSKAYGTNVETSDTDIRGIAVNSQKYLLTNRDFEQVQEDKTDTIIYSLEKIIPLLVNCNPNVIEILGFESDEFLYLSNCGKMLYNNRENFLSKRAVKSFGGYASAQLRRLQNATARDRLDQSDKEKHILFSVNQSLENTMRTSNIKDKGSVKLYVDTAETEGLDSEIFVDSDYTKIPLRQYLDLNNGMRQTLIDYNQISHRNNKKDDLHLNKHAMHLCRLFLMAFDILEKHEIHTYRPEDHDFLMEVRNGKFMDENGLYVKEFYDIIDSYEKRLQEDAITSTLPDNPNMEKIYSIMEGINLVSTL